MYKRNGKSTGRSMGRIKKSKILSEVFTFLQMSEKQKGEKKVKVF